MPESCEVRWRGSTRGGRPGAALPGPAEPEAPELSGAPKAGGAGEETETCGLVFGCVMVAEVLRGQVADYEHGSRSRNGVPGSHRLMRAVHWEVRRVVHGSRHHRHGDHRDHMRERVTAHSRWGRETPSRGRGVSGARTASATATITCRRYGPFPKVVSTMPRPVGQARARVFHRVVSKSGGGGVRAGNVNTPPGWAALPAPVVSGVVSVARRLP